MQICSQIHIFDETVTSSYGQYAHIGWVGSAQINHKSRLWHFSSKIRFCRKNIVFQKHGHWRLARPSPGRDGFWSLALASGGGGHRDPPCKTISSCMEGGVPTPTQDILHKSIKRQPLTSALPYLCKPALRLDFGGAVAQ